MGPPENLHSLAPRSAWGLRGDSRAIGREGSTMPKRISINPADLEWLRNNYSLHPMTVSAARLGICVDTLKRLLVREGLRNFKGAKYIQRPRPTPKDKWTRPCICCGCTDSRPRLQYKCDPCTSQTSAHHDASFELAL